MLKFSMIHLEVLKREVMAAAGITSMTPGECRALSVEIVRATSQRISETTLKRIYGFAISKFKPSLFTIDVLSKYCGYNGWAGFCAKQQDDMVLPEGDVDWNTLQQNAGKISQFTLQALKNRSGVPYAKSIRRAFADAHFDKFIKSGCQGAVLTAPAGYGKTIALCHWVEEKIAAGLAAHNSDIFLFFSSSALMSVLLTNRDINYWILGLLGYGADRDINTLFDPKPKNGRFYLIIDSFDEHALKNEQFQVVLNQVMDIIALHRYDDWFKVVLTMRTATWMNYKNEFEAGDNLWYTGLEPGDNDINVPLLNLSEIRQLCRNIDPSVQTFIAFNAAESFNHPLYLQFYYKRHRHDFSLSSADRFCIYDVIALFILNKVYLGRYSSEKTLLIDALIGEMDLLNRQYKVDMLKAGRVVREYQQAYKELLNIGFLREDNQSDDYHFNISIVFGNDNFLQHSLAKNLQHRYCGKFTPEFVRVFNEQYSESVHKMGVLKWCIINAVKTGQQEAFAMLSDIAGLTTEERTDLMAFIGDVLKNSGPKNNLNTGSPKIAALQGNINN
ncbi:MAG TPA: hypothetical protein VIM55_14060 [Mucilaginibacter sp.]